MLANSSDNTGNVFWITRHLAGYSLERDTTACEQQGFESVITRMSAIGLLYVTSQQTTS